MDHEPIDDTPLFRDFQECVLGNAGEVAKIVLNCGLLDPHGSSLVRFLYRAQEVIQSANGEIVISDVKPNFQQVLIDLFSLDKKFPFYGTEREAVRALQ